MKQKPYLLMPMSGQGTRYKKAGYVDPKPLIKVNGTPMVERLLENFPEDWPTVFVMAENHRDTGLPEVLANIRPEAQQKFIAVHTKGPGEACLQGLELIPDDAPVAVSYCDFGMVWDARQFERFVRDSDCDACLVSYRGFHAHYLNPLTYAYSRMDGERVVEVKEKGSFTAQRENEFASCGIYYFKSARLLREAIKHQYEINLSMNGEFYTSLTVEALLRLKKDAFVRVFEIPGFFQWGTPEQLQEFEYWERSFQSYFKAQKSEATVSQVLMPMAGLGSRFKHISETPKPFLSVNGKAMFEQALSTLPRASKKTVVVGLEQFDAYQNKVTRKDLSWVKLKSTPEGQALSTEAGVSSLDPKSDVIVSSCDHGIVLDPAKWRAFSQNPNCDAAIFTVKGYAGALRKPNAYAYVVPTLHDGAFPKVASVSVKKPVSENPSLDNLLVGTFWFRSAEILQKGINELKKRNVRVNNELYLDSVFDVLASMGHVTRMIPLDGYLCWGDPESLSEAIYWQELFCGFHFVPRAAFPGVE